MTLVGCVTSDEEATRTREFDGMIATSVLFDSGDIDVTLRDSAGNSVASLEWRADEQATTWQVDGSVGGEFERLPLTIDIADEMLYGFWRAAQRAEQDNVAYDSCNSGTDSDVGPWICCLSYSCDIFGCCQNWVCCNGGTCGITGPVHCDGGGY